MVDDVNGAVRNPPARLVVGISGASGAIYGARVLDALNELGVESHLVVTRAADVTLKERRPLVLMVRETPLHLGHLRTMTALAEMGAIIAPPLPALYAKPASIMEMVDQSVGRALDLFGLEWDAVRRWDGLKS